jgi:hypothetical protein
VTLEICVLIRMPLNFANIIALPLLLGIGVAFEIYFVMAWRSGRTAPISCIPVDRGHSRLPPFGRASVRAPLQFLRRSRRPLLRSLEDHVRDSGPMGSDQGELVQILGTNFREISFPPSARPPRMRNRAPNCNHDRRDGRRSKRAHRVKCPPKRSRHRGSNAMDALQAYAIQGPTRGTDHCPHIRAPHTCLPRIAEPCLSTLGPLHIGNI